MYNPLPYLAMVEYKNSFHSISLCVKCVPKFTCLTLKYPIADLYTIHVYDATIGTFIHLIKITLYIQCMVLNVKPGFRHSHILV